MSAERWIELADGVLARRYAELDQTLGLVVGESSCLVIDTGTDATHGAHWAAAVRAVTPLPWQVVLTHGHFDHVFGTEAFAPCPVWATSGCARYLAAGWTQHRDTWAGRYRREGRPELAARIDAVDLVPPDRPIDAATRLDLGGRHAVLTPVAAHTDHDLVVHLPAERITFAGDLVEQGAPPAFADSRPAAWPAALDAILALGGTTIVPGHGDPVDRDFVAAQRAELAAVAQLCRAVAAGELTRAEATARSPYPEPYIGDALARPA